MDAAQRREQMAANQMVAPSPAHFLNAFPCGKVQGKGGVRDGMYSSTAAGSLLYLCPGGLGAAAAWGGSGPGGWGGGGDGGAAEAMAARSWWDAVGSIGSWGRFLAGIDKGDGGRGRPPSRGTDALPREHKGLGCSAAVATQQASGLLCAREASGSSRAIHNKKT